MDTPIYHGIFFDKCDIENTIRRIDSPHKKSLPKEIKYPHITFGFKVPIKDYFPIGEEATIKIVGYGNDGGNEGLLAEIPYILRNAYQGASLLGYEDGEYGHVTVSYDASRRNPVDTGNIIFEWLSAPIEITGTIGYFDKATSAPSYII